MSITHIDETKRSAPHRRVEKVLDRLKISYLSEHDEFPPYCVDIYLPEWHAAVEVDGPGHSRKKDAMRDAALRDVYQVPVLHLPTGMTAEHLEITLLSYIKNVAKTAEKRKAAWRTSS